MSGHLQRLAARSVGSSVAAVARPRLPARFEPSDRGGAAGTGVFDELPANVATPPAPAPGREGAATGGRREAPSRNRADSARVAARSASRRRSATGDGPVSPPAAPAPATAANAHLRAAQPSAGEATPALSATADDRPAPQRRTPAAATARVTAMPAAQRRPAPAPERPASGAPRPAAQPPVVRVHIGRLEVRANLQPAPAATPAPAHAEPPREELALSAYLRGERAAR